jgi:hypothetical protein
MPILQWILKPFCRHGREIFRRRDGCMGLECLSCFRWRPLDEGSPAPYSQGGSRLNRTTQMPSDHPA